MNIAKELHIIRSPVTHQLGRVKSNTFFFFVRVPKKSGASPISPCQSLLTLPTANMAEEMNMELVTEPLVAEIPGDETKHANESEPAVPAELDALKALDLTSLDNDPQEQHSNGDSKFVTVQDEPAVKFGGSAPVEQAPGSWKSGLTPRASHNESSSDCTLPIPLTTFLVPYTRLRAPLSVCSNPL